jgi:putative protease
LNKKAEEFYESCGVNNIEPAAESGLSLTRRKVMTTKYCIRYQFDMCCKYNKNASVDEPLYLVDEMNKKYPLKFNCSDCVMEVYF